MRCLICCVESHHKGLRVRAGTVAFTRSTRRTQVGLQLNLEQSVVEQHFQRPKICKEAPFSEKKERKEKRLKGVDSMTGGSSIDSLD